MTTIHYADDYFNLYPIYCFQYYFSGMRHPHYLLALLNVNSEQLCFGLYNPPPLSPAQLKWALHLLTGPPQFLLPLLRWNFCTSISFCPSASPSVLPLATQQSPSDTFLFLVAVLFFPSIYLNDFQTPFQFTAR